MINKDPRLDFLVDAAVEWRAARRAPLQVRRLSAAAQQLTKAVDGYVKWGKK
jgi:hypothetical protein